MSVKYTCKKCSYTKISQGFPHSEYFYIEKILTFRRLKSTIVDVPRR